MINGGKLGVSWVGKDLWWGADKLTSSCNTPLLGSVLFSLFIVSTRAPFLCANIHYLSERLFCREASLVTDCFICLSQGTYFPISIYALYTVISLDTVTANLTIR